MYGQLRQQRLVATGWGGKRTGNDDRCRCRHRCCRRCCNCRLPTANSTACKDNYHNDYDDCRGEDPPNNGRQTTSLPPPRLEEHMLHLLRQMSSSGENDNCGSQGGETAGRSSQGSNIRQCCCRVRAMLYRLEMCALGALDVIGGGYYGNNSFNLIEMSPHPHCASTPPCTEAVMFTHVPPPPPLWLWRCPIAWMNNFVLMCLTFRSDQSV